MMPVTRAIVVLDQASGALRMDGGRTIGLDLHDSVNAATSACREKGVQLILAIPGLSSADFAGSLDGFVDGMTIMPLAPLSYAQTGFAESIAALSKEEPRTALVSADRRLRGDARAAAMVPAPHAALLPMLADGITPEASRITGPRPTLEQLALRSGIVPMHFQPAPDIQQWALIGLFSPDALIEAVMRRLSVQPLPYDTLTHDLVWARIDQVGVETRAALAGRRVLYAEPGQVLFALAPGENAEALHLHGAHGHAEVLLPDPGLLRPAPRVEAGLDVRMLDVSTHDLLEPVASRPVPLSLVRLSKPTVDAVAADYLSDLDRYAGMTTLDAMGPIVSRHTAHRDNKRTEVALIADLTALGYSPWRHDFVHAGALHSNIIADLPGTGTMKVRADVLEPLRRMLREPRLPRPIGPLPVHLRQLIGGEEGLAATPDPELRNKLERALHLRPWHPWWHEGEAVPGLGSGLVIIGAHMDSTAGFEPDYSAQQDAAPGRDDNGSGLAGVLSLARFFSSLRSLLTHTIRFCFFNAEESGLVGSKAYASHLKALGAPVRAVICMDMIGFNSDQHHIFEIHAGYTDPAIRDLSLPLADLVADAALTYGALAPAQVYRGTGYTGAPDRNIYDGAINRSDHAAFHQQGYGAVLVSEDFFVNLSSEPASDANPNYHRQSDRQADVAYAKDIVAAVALAALRLGAAQETIA